MLVTGERHLRLVLGEYVDHYNTHRPHRTLHQKPPTGRPCPPAAIPSTRILRRDRIGGLIHEYAQVAYGDTVFGTHRLEWDAVLLPGLVEGLMPMVHAGRRRRSRRKGGYCMWQ